MNPANSELGVDELLAVLRCKLERGEDGVEAQNLNWESEDNRSRWVKKYSERLDNTIFIANVLSYRRNLGPPVNRLPFEILGIVFSHLRPEYDAIFSSETNFKGANSWIAVTHVCRRWRLSALNNPQLWRSIFLPKKLRHPGSLANTFFARSNPLPIEFVHHLGSVAFETRELHLFYTSLLEQPGRIQAIYLKGNFHDTAWDLLQRPLPNLITLALEIGLDENSQPMRGGRVPHILGDWTSTLKRLSMSQFCGPIQIFPNLTHLSLTEECSLTITDNEFLDILESLPLLEVLYSKGGAPMVISPGFYTFDRRVHLPALQKIEIRHGTRDDKGYSLCLLHMLSLPAAVEVVWDISLTRFEFGEERDVWKYELPLPELLGHVTKMCERPDRLKDSFVLCRDTLSVGSSGISQHRYPDGDLRKLPQFLRNVRWLYLTTFMTRPEDAFNNGFRPLRSYRLVESLHLDGYLGLSKLLIALEQESVQEEEHQMEDNWLPTYGFPEDFWPISPRLSELVIYIGDKDIKNPATARKILKEVRNAGGFPTQIPDSAVITRQRPGLGTSYALRFKSGNTESAFNDD